MWHNITPDELAELTDFVPDLEDDYEDLDMFPLNVSDLTDDLDELDGFGYDYVEDDDDLTDLYGYDQFEDN